MNHHPALAPILHLHIQKSAIGAGIQTEPQAQCQRSAQPPSALIACEHMQQTKQNLLSQVRITTKNFGEQPPTDKNQIPIFVI
ncbi:hypothetical protein [Comamonas sp.]|jgi:hypothetical protein|uniref:hypothetical protein n=1 Tax=Comamonas sp. TaxID=34028 RepID=UPI003D118970